VLRGRSGAAVRATVRTTIGATVRTTIGATVRTTIGAAVRTAIGTAVRAAIGATVGAASSAAVRGAVLCGCGRVVVECHPNLPCLRTSPRWCCVPCETYVAVMRRPGS
jgi:hypothetical protein